MKMNLFYMYSLNTKILYRDGFGLGLGKNLHGFPRYKIVGRTDEGEICEDLVTFQLYYIIIHNAGI